MTVEITSIFDGPNAAVIGVEVRLSQETPARYFVTATVRMYVDASDSIAVIKERTMNGLRAFGSIMGQQ